MIGITRFASSVNKNVPETLDRGLRGLFDFLASEAQATAVINAPANTGQLRGSIQLFRDYRPPVFSAGIQTNLPYAIVMEYGRRAGADFPNIGALAFWVVRKRLRERVRTRVRGGGTIRVVERVVRSIAQAERVAFVIGRSIVRKGISARRFFGKAADRIDSLLGPLASELELEVKRAWDKGGE